MSERIDTAGVRRTQEDLIVSLKERARNSDCWCPNSRAAAAMLAALDEIDRLTAALAEAEDRGAAQMRERAADLCDCPCQDGMGDALRERADTIRALPLREPGAAP